MGWSVCWNCGEKFDETDARDEFDMEYPEIGYSNLREPLCEDCAKKVIEDEIEGICFLNCSRCGKQFDYADDSGTCNSILGRNLWSAWWDLNSGVLCSDCVERAYSEKATVYEHEEQEDSMEDGCAACGNPAYPDCKASCPLYDE